MERKADSGLNSPAAPQNRNGTFAPGSGARLDALPPAIHYETVRSQMSRTPASKGELTRQHVIEQAAGLFNQRGYEAASMSEIMALTGLQKGGIYRHFSSKQELVLAAFEFAVEQMRERFRAELARRPSALEKLRGILLVYSKIPSNPPVPGGCPMLNASIEADDGDPELRNAARTVMTELKRTIARLVRQAQVAGDLHNKLDAGEFAEVFIASVEGAVMLSKLHGHDAPMRHMVRHMESWLESCAG